MKFGPAALGEAEGAILAHAVSVPGGVLRKGRRLSAADIARLRDAGLAEVVVARLDPGDVHEDEAAQRLAGAVRGAGVRVEKAATGRANLFAEAAGLLVVDRAGIDALNAVDPAITFATLPAFAAVEVGRMVATVKIIPFAVEGAVLERALARAAAAPLVRIAPFRPLKVGVVSTLLPSLKSSVVTKTHAVLAERLAPAGARIVAEMRVPHETAAVGQAIRDLAPQSDLVVVFGASAVVDRRDVIPSALEAAGGAIRHLGMPVDPGNLLLLGALGTKPVLGAPGCARSPKENGFDWVLQRLLAGLDVTPEDIAGLGVGGLLMEIVSRPAPRQGAPEAGTAAERRIGAVLLAAGKSSRMGGPNKLLARIGDKPLVRIAAEAALESRARPVIAVLGRDADAVAASLSGLDLVLVKNPAYAEGLSTSLKRGIAALPEDVEAAIVLLGDMPGVTAKTVDRLIGAYDPGAGALVVVPTHKGQRGNPVLWSRRFFPELMAIEGDIGARRVAAANPDAVAEVEMGPEVALDLDTPEALAAAGASLGFER